MRVTFTKTTSRHYTISIDRERGPRLLPRGAPGFDNAMPHDLAHYVVEDFYGIELGVFGQIAAGASGIFFPAADNKLLRLRRASARINWGTPGRR